MADGADEALRKRYWAAQMEDASAFMSTIMSHPMEVPCLEPMVQLERAAADAGVEVVFSQKPHANGAPRLFWLRESLVPQFIEAAREMESRGWVLQVEDGYRCACALRGSSCCGRIVGI